MRFLFLLIMALIPVSFSFAKEPKNEGKELLDKFAGVMNFKKGWLMASYGWKYDEGKIKRLSIGFRITESPDLNNARRDIVEATQELINYINNDEKNKEYFLCFPVSEENFKISISYVNDKGLLLRDGNICYALMVNSKLDYSVKGTKMLNTIHKETFDQALSIVRKNENQKYLKISKEG